MQEGKGSVKKKDFRGNRPLSDANVSRDSGRRGEPGLGMFGRFREWRARRAVGNVASSPPHGSRQWSASKKIVSGRV